MSTKHKVFVTADYPDIKDHSNPGIRMEQLKGLGQAYINLAERFAEKIDKDMTVTIQRPDAYQNSKNADMEVVIRPENSEILYFRQTLKYDWKSKKFDVYGNLFNMSMHIQGKGIAHALGGLSEDLAKNAARTLKLDANLDIGGYAWLRKGGWPDGGKEFLQKILQERIEYGAENNNFDYLLSAQELQFALGNMTEEEARLFCMSPNFRGYKKFFLGTSWKGSFDITDKLTRAGLAGDKAKVAEILLDRIEENGYTSISKKPLLELAKNRKNKKPLTANQKIVNDFIAQHTYLLRYSDGLAAELLSYLEETNLPLNDALIAWAEKVQADDPADAAAALDEAFTEAVTDLRAPAWDKVEEDFTKQMEELGVETVEGTMHIINDAVPTVLGMQAPPSDRLAAIVNSYPTQGKVLSTWLEQAKNKDIDNIVAQTKAGIIQGKTPKQVAALILGNESNNFEDGAVTKKLRRDIQTLTRTVSATIQSQAREALYDANDDVFDQELFVATLDSHTTIQCAANDSKVFKRKQGPQTPLHFNCRSLRVPYFDADRLGNRGFDPSTEKSLVKEYAEQNDLGNITSRDKLPHGTKGDFDKWARKRRRELIGQTPATTSYADWLKTQSNDFQDELLGKTKAQLFRDGNLSLDKFVSQDGKPLTLAELKTKYGVNTDRNKSLNDAEVSAINSLTPAEKSKPYKDRTYAWEVAKHKHLLDESKELFADADPELKYYTKRYMTDSRFWKPLNEAMRNNEVLPERLLKGKQALDVVTRLQTVPVDRLYRGDKNLPLDITEAEKLIGETQKQASFLSTSIGPRAANQFGIRRELTKGWKPPTPDEGFASSLLEFNTKGRPPHGVYISAANETKKMEKIHDRIERTGKIEGETEVLLPSGKSYKIVGIREEIVYNETYDQDIKVLVYEAVFTD